MRTLHWQKSTYSGDGLNCFYIATGITDTRHLRESDNPDVIPITTTQSLRA
ncbi:DUF397 domain-containing protein [Streptomyces bobili]|uniref:DUF397 domain-containing protein n=1 Tax=Streptomyces bobili TaxID=67280 RepID=UPI00379FF4DE